MNIKKFVQLIIKFRWLIAITIPIITLLFATQLQYAQFDGSYRIWFSKDSKTLKQYDAFRKTFGNDDSIIIVFSDTNGIMNKKALAVIDRLTEKLWQTKYIARVDSLTNYQYIYTNNDSPDDIIIEDFIGEINTLTVQSLKEKKSIALKEDLLINRIISSDGKTTMIVGRLTPKAGSTLGASKHIKESVMAYIEEEKASGYIFHLAGGPIVNQTFATLAKYDITTFTPLVILLALLLLWIIFRSFTGVIITILVIIFTFIIVLSLQVILGYKLNNFTVNMPIFIVAIGIADTMHLYWVYILARRSGLDNYQAISESIIKNIIPIFLTSITTAVGFASLMISNIVPIETLGIATSTAAIIAFVLTILFMPAMLAIINPHIKSNTSKEEGEKVKSTFIRHYVSFIVKHDIKIIFMSILLFGWIGLGLLQLNVDSNAVKYFKEGVPFRDTVKIIQEKLTGPMSYEIVIDSKQKDGIKSPQFMQEVERFSIALKKNYPEVRHISSLIDVVKKFNQIIDQKKEIPTDNTLIAQYLLLYSLSLPQGMEINDKLDIEERLLRVSVSMNVLNTSKDLEIIQWIENWWEKVPYSAEVNGQTSMFAHMQSDVTDTLIKSILIAIIIISILMLFIFKNIKIIPIFMIPNILPIILIVGAMGWLGLNIDIGVAISGAIILGIAVDDTIHFLIKYKEAREKGYNLDESLIYVMQYAGSAIIFTTIVLSIAFTVFTFSQFTLNANFGMVTALALSIAVLVDLVLLPAILSRYDNNKKSFLAKNKNKGLLC